jgi:hypothetical protein
LKNLQGKIAQQEQLLAQENLRLTEVSGAFGCRLWC